MSNSSEVAKKSEINKMMVGILVSEHEEKLYEAAKVLKERLESLKRKSAELKRDLDQKFKEGLMKHNPDMDFKVERLRLDEEDGEVAYAIHYTLRISETKSLRPYEIFRGKIEDVHMTRIRELAEDIKEQRSLLTKITVELNDISRKERKIKASFDRETLSAAGISIDVNKMMLLEDGNGKVGAV